MSGKKNSTLPRSHVCMKKKITADMKETETARQNRVNNRMLIKKNKQNGGNRAQE